MRRLCLPLPFALLVACSSGPSPESGALPTEPVPSTFQPPDAGSVEEHKRVFITDKTYRGDFGGLEAADRICTDAAKAANLGGDRWKAWLSDSRLSAVDRIDAVGPWYNLRGERAIVTKESIALLEYVPPIGTPGGFWPESKPLYFWTGSDEQGFGEDVPSCRDWTVANTVQGRTGFFTSHGYSHAISYDCSERFNLLCLEQ